MTDAIDLTTEQRKTLNDLLRRFLPGIAVWAYGSRVKWTARPTSDLDLVAFTTPEQRAQVADLKDALAESNLPFPVDLHVWDEVPERFREIIRKEYVVVQEVKQAGSGLNMAGWKDLTLGEFVALQRGHDLTEPERRQGNIPVMGSAGQNGLHDTALAKGPGIVIGRSGASFGQVHFCTTDYWPHNTGLYVTDFKGNDPRFAYYLFKVLDLDRYNSGSAQPSLNRNFIYPIPICVPEPAEQEAIAHILGTLDDKIELNRRMNETLEAMARALFKSWFVDFDPVRAKAEGRDTGLPKHIADLFPDSFEDSELGEIPRGWKVGVVSDLADVTSGKRPEERLSHASRDGSVPLWGGNGPMAFVQEALFNEPLLLTGRVGTLGSVFRITGPCWPSDNTLVIRANRPADFEYLFLQLRMIDFASLNRGSTQPLLTQTDLKSQRIPIPVPAVLDHFSRMTSHMHKRIDQAEKGSRTLGTLRDTLLPTLISGQLQVPVSTIERVGQA